jgi:hypothetical protein
MFSWRIRTQVVVAPRGRLAPLQRGHRLLWRWILGGPTPQVPTRAGIARSPRTDASACVRRPRVAAIRRRRARCAVLWATGTTYGAHRSDRQPARHPHTDGQPPAAHPQDGGCSGRSVTAGASHAVYVRTARPPRAVHTPDGAREATPGSGPPVRAGGVAARHSSGNSVWKPANSATRRRAGEAAVNRKPTPASVTK